MASIFGILITFVTWLLSRRPQAEARQHDEEMDEAAAMTGAVTAISTASKTVADVVATLISPLQARIALLEREIKEKDVQYEARLAKMQGEHEQRFRWLQAEHDSMKNQFIIVMQYVRRLRNQIIEIGGEPEPVPLELTPDVVDRLENLDDEGS